MKKALLLYFFALIFLPVDSFGQTSRFVKEYVYQLEDEDSKNSAKIKAQEQLYKALFAEVLVYVRKSNATAESAAADISVSLYKEAITATAQSKIKILDEKFDGFEYRIKGEIEANVAEINAYAAQLNERSATNASSATVTINATNNTSSNVSSIQTVRNVTNNAVNAIESTDKAAKALGGLGKVGGGLSGAANSARQVKSAVDNTLDAVESIQNITGATGGQQGTDAVRNVTNNAVNAIESTDKAAKAIGGLGKVGGGLSGAANSARQVKSAVDNTLDAVESIQNITGAVSSSSQRTSYDVSANRGENGKYFVFSMAWEYVAMFETKGFGGCIELGGIKENGFYNTFQFSAGAVYFGTEWNTGGCFNKDGVKGNYKSVLGFNVGYRQVLKYVRFVSNNRYDYDDYDEFIGRNWAFFGGFWKLMFGSESNFDITNKFMLGGKRNPYEQGRYGEVSYIGGGNLTYVLSVGLTITKPKK